LFERDTLIVLAAAVNIIAEWVALCQLSCFELGALFCEGSVQLQLKLVSYLTEATTWLQNAGPAGAVVGITLKMMLALLGASTLSSTLLV
jgi:hypothetical protein